MEAAKSNFLLRGYFRKKEKAAEKEKKEAAKKVKDAKKEAEKRAKKLKQNKK
jgi:phospholipid/cholesterol/gamma-HCH transport system substrate-binding protein